MRCLFLGRGLTALGLSALLAACGPSEPVAKVQLPEADSPAARLVADRCGRCHAPPDPRRHSAEEWPAVVERMRVHMVRQANEVLSDEETRVVLEYLTRHGRKS